MCSHGKHPNERKLASGPASRTLRLALRGYSCASRTRFARFARTRARRARDAPAARARLTPRRRDINLLVCGASRRHTLRYSSRTGCCRPAARCFCARVSERSERQNFLIAYNLPRTAKNTCAKNHDDRSNDATRRGKHTNTQTHKPTNKQTDVLS